MKKRCRVYKKLPTAQAGYSDPNIVPATKPMSWDKPTQTQDSQNNPVHEEITNNFMSWIRNSDKKVKEKAMLEEDIARANAGEFAIGGNIAPTIDERSGYESGDYGFQPNRYLAAAEAATSNMPGIMEHILTTAQGIDAMSPMFKGNKNKQPNKPITSNPLTNNGQSIDGIPDSGFGSEPKDMFGKQTDTSFGRPNALDVNLDDSFNKPVEKFNPYMIKAEDGISFPGDDIYDLDTMYTDTSGNAFSNFMEEIGPDPEMEINSENQYQTAADYNAEQSKGFNLDEDPYAGMSWRKERRHIQKQYRRDDRVAAGKPAEGKFANFFKGDPNKSNAQHQNEARGMITTGKGLTGIFGYGQQRRDDKEAKLKASNIYEFTKVQDDDKGGYLANAPGIGTNFRPDDTTFMGHNTMISQEGGAIFTDEEYQIDGEYDLPESKVKDLIAQGYELEYLD